MILTNCCVSYTLMKPEINLKLFNMQPATLKLHDTSIDAMHASDSIPREALWARLHRINIPTY